MVRLDRRIQSGDYSAWKNNRRRLGGDRPSPQKEAVPAVRNLLPLRPPLFDPRSVVLILGARRGIDSARFARSS